MKNNLPAFREYQDMRQWWLWLILIITAVPTAGILLYQLTTGKMVGDKPASNTILLVITLLVPAPIFFGIYFAKLTTVIDRTGIEYGWNMPTSDLNFIAWNNIKSARIIRYKFVGYGFRVSREYGIVYNTKGNKGLELVETNGRKLLIGTQKPEEMQAYLDSLPQNSFL